MCRETFISCSYLRAELQLKTIIVSNNRQSTLIVFWYKYNLDIFHSRILSQLASLDRKKIFAVTATDDKIQYNSYLAEMVPVHFDHLMHCIATTEYNLYNCIKLTTVQVYYLPYTPQSEQFDCIGSFCVL